ncbi:MAG: beta-lactamase family protein [Cyclobacteriaceae bacterium]|nr:beta-lactamase family protein [Cyclobacteriaceae bacterium]
MRLSLATLTVCLTALLGNSCKQESNDATTARIDSLFRFWNNPNSPGAAVLVMKDGKTVFSKGYGMANLEYGIPITPASIFHIASESKQYTAFCIVLLAQQGKLNLNDDIRKYLPYVPDFGKTITIRHLIYHTSGLRDQWQLLAIGGESLDDVIHQEHVIKLVSKQKELNFAPGERSLYCNTGYTLMAEIVKQVSGQSLRAFAEENIFKPLAMTQTHFHDDNTEIVRNRTYSYDSISKEKFVNSPLNYATVGATSLFTTVEDEAKWLDNFATAKVGGREAIQQMHELGVLNNGKKLEYAFAIAIDTVDGHLRIGHGGADAGYRTYAVRFPEEKLDVVVFSNLAQFDPTALAMKVAEIYLPKQPAKSNASVRIKGDSTRYAFYAGRYATSEGNPVQVIDSAGLYIDLGWKPLLLQPLSDTTFSLFDDYATLTFSSQRKPTDHFLFRTQSEERRFERYEKPVLSEQVLATYTGTYTSSELDTRYEIVNEKGKLILQHRKYPDVTLEPLSANQFTTPHWWMRNLLITRNTRGEVTGFEVNSGRILHLKFQKQP